jgi:CBS domain-containing protein
MGQVAGGHKRGVLSVSSQDSVFHALEMMASADVGALVVVDGARVAGLFTERDYARKVILQDRNSRDSKVGDLMGDAVQVAQDTTLEQGMALMATGTQRVRYLVVVDDAARPVGVVSIGDLIKQQMAGQEVAIQAMEQYIVGGR